MSMGEMSDWIRRHSDFAQSLRERKSDDTVKLAASIDSDIGRHQTSALVFRSAVRKAASIVGSWSGAGLVPASLRPIPVAQVALPTESKDDASSVSMSQASPYREVSLVEPEEADPDWRVLAAAVDVPPSDSIPRRLARRFSLDLRPAVFLSRGGTIEAIVGANCHHYMEFMTVQRSMLLEPQWPSSAEGGASASGSKAGELPVRPEGSSVVEAPVPCSKSEVFSNPVLTLGEKRAISRFLMHCVGLIAEADGMTAQQMNDTTLAAGRSLHRPQNKRALDPVFDLAEHERGMPFAAYLRRCGVTGRLLRMVLYAVTELQQEQEGLEDASGGSKATASSADSQGQIMEAASGMGKLLVYLRSVGRFSANAYVTALYGSGDTPQAFSRAACLVGNIFNVRCPVAGLCLPDPEAGAETSDGGPGAAAGGGGTAAGATAESAKAAADSDAGGGLGIVEAPADSSVGVVDTGGLLMCSQSIIASSAFVPWLYPDLCPPGLLSKTAPGGGRGAALRGDVRSRCAAVARIVVISNRPLLSPDKPRAAIAVPPGSPFVRNERTIQAVQLDSTANVCPAGYCVFYASTEIDTEDTGGGDQAHDGSAGGGGGAKETGADPKTQHSGGSTTGSGSRRRLLERRALEAVGGLRRLVAMLTSRPAGDKSESPAGAGGPTEGKGAGAGGNTAPEPAEQTSDGAGPGETGRPPVLFQACHAEVLPLAPAPGSAQEELLQLVGGGRLHVAEAEEGIAPASFSSDWEADRAVRLFEKLCPEGFFLEEARGKQEGGEDEGEGEKDAGESGESKGKQREESQGAAGGGEEDREAGPEAATEGGEAVEADKATGDGPPASGGGDGDKELATDFFPELDDPSLDEFLD